MLKHTRVPWTMSKGHGCVSTWTFLRYSVWRKRTALADDIHDQVYCFQSGNLSSSCLGELFANFFRKGVVFAEYLRKKIFYTPKRFADLIGRHTHPRLPLRKDFANMLLTPSLINTLAISRRNCSGAGFGWNPQFRPCHVWRKDDLWGKLGPGCQPGGVYRIFGEQ